MIRIPNILMENKIDGHQTTNQFTKFLLASGKLRLFAHWKHHIFKFGFYQLGSGHKLSPILIPARILVGLVRDSPATWIIVIPNIERVL